MSDKNGKNKNVKKLFVDAHTFDESYQGIRTFLKGIYSHLKLDSEELQVYLAANNIDNLKAEFKNQPFKYIKLKHKNKYLRMGYEIPKIIRTYNFDYAHFNYYLPLFLSSKCKYIVTIHDVLFLDYPKYFPLKYKVINGIFFRRSALKSHIITTVSEYSAKRIAEFYKIPKKSIAITPNAVAKEYLENKNKTKDKNDIKEHFGIDNFIVYVSRIEPRKNHKVLVKAYEDMKLWEKDVMLVFIGERSFKDKELTNYIKKVNIICNGKIRHLKNINNTQLIKFYNAAELSVFPSLFEGFGIPPLESAVLKTPTICSDTTAMKDYTFFEDCFFDPNSVSELKSKIQEVFNKKDSQTYKDSLDLISQEIIKKYTWERSANVIKDIILK